MFENVKCPYCGNPVNSWSFSHWNTDLACFIAECWSGDLNKEMPRHLFKIWVRIEKEIFMESQKSSVKENIKK